MSISSNENQSGVLSYYENSEKLTMIFKWLKDQMENVMAEAITDFFGHEVTSHMVAVSERPYHFWNDSDYFVSQLDIIENCSVQIRVSDTFTGLILQKSLENRETVPKYFQFKDLSKLESQIMSSFCTHTFLKLKPLFIERRKIKSQKNPSKKIYHLTFLFNTPERIKADRPSGKIIISFPVYIMQQPELLTQDLPVTVTKYLHSMSEVNIFIGTAIINLADLKNLVKNDILILDKSNLYELILFDDDCKLSFKVNPSSELSLSIQSEEYNTMSDNVNPETEKDFGQAIWDKLEVEVAAEFEKIKLPLGEIKNMTEGLVVEVASLSENEVKLHIDGKDLATGELVIVGDKYGVMIKKILYKGEEVIEQADELIEEDNEEEYIDNVNQDEDDDEDFNYDDLGLDDDF